MKEIPKLSDMIETMAPGKVAYDGYCSKRGWKSVHGEPLPQFDQQSPELQEAWNAAGLAVIKEGKEMVIFAIREIANILESEDLVNPSAENRPGE